MIDNSTRKKLLYALRLDKALAFVWQAGPVIFILNLILLVVEGLLPLAVLYLIKLIVDKVAWALSTADSHAAFMQVATLVAVAGGVSLINVLVQQVSKYVKEIQTLSVTDRVYDVLHEKSLDLDLAFYENPEYFDTLHRAQTQGPYRPIRIVTGLTGVLKNGISLVALAGLLFSFHWGIALVLFAAAVPGLVVRLINVEKMFKWQNRRTRTEREADYYNYMITGQPCAKEIRLFGLGPFFHQRFSSLRSIIRNEKAELIKLRSTWDFVAQACAVVAVFSALMLIAQRCIAGQITLGDLVMYFQAFQKALVCMKDFFENLAGLYEDHLFISHFYELLDLEPHVCEADDPRPVDGPFEKELAFEGVSFAYPGTGRLALDDVSFGVKPGEVIALVGENGSGKTTLIKLLSRLYDPVGGRITMDGVDLKDLRINDLRGQISVIFQDFIRYQMTAKENIWMGDVTRPCDEDRVRKASRYADAGSLIESLPNSYETMLGKWMGKGAELSLGQWQKVALARAFYSRAGTVVLDEPTSSLDPESEYQVFLTFRQLLEKRTAFLISHRFSTVKMADRILVLSKGRLIESGTHDELMALGGTYCNMYSLQAGNYA
jgi:ATP-binding cassette, subfamily B, bacterial